MTPSRTISLQSLRGLCDISAALMLVTMLVAGAFAPVNAENLRMPPHEKVVLKNGLTVLLLVKHGVPLINISTIVKAGAASDPAGQEGLATITAALLRKGTKTRTAQQFSADLDYIGGALEAEATSDYSVVNVEFLTKDLARGLELYSDALLHPTFPDDETTKLLAQSVDAIRAAKDDPQSVAIPYYCGYLYGTHPYARSASGDEISLTTIRRDDVVKFYESNYAPSNTIIAIAGEFNVDEMKSKLDQTFGAWPARTVKPEAIPPATPSKGKRLLLVDKPDATQVYFAIGNTGVSATDPDRVAIRVVNTIFGGRFTSQLNEALRVESGYTYGAESFFDDRKVAGPFAIFSFTKNETTTPAIDLALQVLAKLHKDGVTDEQLKSAKNYIKGQFPPSIESHEFYGLGDDEVNQLEARVDAITPEIARQVIQKHFPSENLVFVLIGQASTVGPAVKKYTPTQDTRPISDPGFWPAPVASKK
jgi:zinc protease